MEGGWNVQVWLVGVASGSGWNRWVWLAGGGCGLNLYVWLVGVVVRRYIRRFRPGFLAAASLLLFIFKNVFSSCSSTFCN